MSIFSISRKYKSPDALPTPSIASGLQQLPSTIRDHISSYLTSRITVLPTGGKITAKIVQIIQAADKLFPNERKDA